MSAPRSVASAVSVDAVLQELKGKLPAARYKEAEGFLRHLLQRVPQEDLSARSAADWAALGLDLLEFARVRKPGQAAVRVFHPGREEHGFESPHTVLQVVTDDSPFLVDSVGMAVNAAGQLAYAVIHPVFLAERDAGGHVLQLSADGAGGKGRLESMM